MGDEVPRETGPAQEGPGANGAQSPRPHDSRGWDGKLRVERRAVLANPGALSDDEASDEDALPPEQIAADEG